MDQSDDREAYQKGYEDAMRAATLQESLVEPSTSVKRKVTVPQHHSALESKNLTPPGHHQDALEDMYDRRRRMAEPQTT